MLLLLLPLALLPVQQAQAAQSQYRVLHHFVGKPDGQGATAPVVLDGSGNIFGTTYFGGAKGYGMVFELIPSVAPGKWIRKTIHSFCATTCADGAFPEGGLAIDSSGNLFGTVNTSNSGGGLVYKMSYDPGLAKWTYKVIYNFCSLASCADGQNAKSGVLLDASGNLYGVTEQGGTNGAGVVYELTPNASHSRYTEKVLYNFCSLAICADGGYPDNARLIMDAAGNIYGTTRNGGNGGGTSSGVVFELTPNATKTVWTETVLHAFCSEANCADGRVPEAGVIMDKSGNLFGTTSGGAHQGLVYELVPNASTGIWTERIVRDLCTASPCLLGEIPSGELVLDGSDRLIGTATSDTPVNNSDNGIVFALTPNASRTHWSISKLAALCGATGCQHFIHSSGLVIDSSNNMFATTFDGGKYSLGSVYELVSP